MVAGIGDLSRGVWPDAEKRRGGSGCGNVGTFPRTGSRRVGRVGPSVSKITRARNQKRPGTSGCGRNQEGEASNETPSVGMGPQTRCIAFGNPIRLWAVFKRDSAMDRLRRTSQVHATPLGSWTGGAHVRSVYAPEPLDLRFMIWVGRLWRDALIRVHQRSSVVPLLFVRVCATVEKAKHPKCGKFFIPSGTRSYTAFGPRPRTEFRHDSCNTEHR